MADSWKPAPCKCRRRPALRDAVHARGGQPDGTGGRLWASDLRHAQLVPDGAKQPASGAAGRAGKPRCVDSVAVVLRPADSGQGPAGRGRRSRRAAGGGVSGAHAVCQCELWVRSPLRASAATCTRQARLTESGHAPTLAGMSTRTRRAGPCRWRGAVERARSCPRRTWPVFTPRHTQAPRPQVSQHPRIPLRVPDSFGSIFICQY
jgi:hypothetical protein